MKRQHYQSREEEMNAEASYFAMHLLVPDSLLAKEDLAFDWTDDKALTALAERYGVPIGVMVLRIREFTTEAKKGR